MLSKKQTIENRQSFHAKGASLTACRRLRATAWDVYKVLRVVTPRQFLRALGKRIWPISILVRRYFRRRFGRKVWTSVNHSAIEAFQKNRPHLNAWQQEALDQLTENGIFVSHVQQLTSASMDMRTLEREVQPLLDDPDFQRQIRRRESRDGSRWYFIRAFGLKPRRPLPKSLAMFLLNNEILDVVNTYLGLWSRMGYADVMHTLPVSEGERTTDAQLWHRDHEDVRAVNVYVHIGDVREDNGPLIYARQTQLGGKCAGDIPPRPAYAVVLTDEELSRRVPQENLFTCTGESGTLIICDCVGFHRGAWPVHRPRTVLVSRFVSDAAINICRYESPGLRRDELELAAQYALGLGPC